MQVGGPDQSLISVFAYGPGCQKSHVPCRCAVRVVKTQTNTWLAGDSCEAASSPVTLRRKVPLEVH